MQSTVNARPRCHWQRLNSTCKSPLSLFYFLILALAFFASAAQANPFSRFQVDDELLPDLEAFQVVQGVVEGNQLVVAWQSAPQYYLYKKNFKIVSSDPAVQLGEVIFPQGEIENDPLFGEVEVYFGQVELRAPISLVDEGTKSVELELHAQGCNKPVGVCYAPQKRSLKVDLSGFVVGDANASEVNSIADTAKVDKVTAEPLAVAKPLSNENLAGNSEYTLWFYVLTAFVAGLGLVFTPCVLPMLPILSGIIVGQQSAPVSRMRGGLLSIAYVLGTAITYTAMGVLAGAAGLQLQAYFQHPVVISVMTVILVLLALSMFGAFTLQLPSALQTKINESSSGVKAGTLFFAVIMGLLSALIVSACVSPLLIMALGVAITKGDPVLGGTMMFAMAMGMGVLLVAFGFGASWLLPKAGVWMDRVKDLFGFLLLAVAIVVLSSIKQVPILLVWSPLLLMFGFWLWLNASSSPGNTVFQALLKALALIGFLWGSLALIGGLTGGSQLDKPLDQISMGRSVVSENLVFQSVKTEAGLIELLAQAKQNKQPVLVDYYADWCTDCVRMERTTFQDPDVKTAVKSWLLIKADVTKVNPETEKLKQHYGVFGPPATIFISATGVEQQDMRRYGYIKSKDFLPMAARLANAL